MASQDPTSYKDHAQQTSAHVKIELRFQSKFCSVSGSPLCFLKIRLKSTEASRISLNRARPIIEFLEDKDDNAPSGLPLLSFSDAADKANEPIFSYHLDICHERGREKQLLAADCKMKAEDFISLSGEGYTFTHCINMPWGYIFAYHQISKIYVQRCYRLSTGLYGERKTQGAWYAKQEVKDVQAVCLELDPSSQTMIRLIV